MLQLQNFGFQILNVIFNSRPFSFGIQKLGLYFVALKLEYRVSLGNWNFGIQTWNAMFKSQNFAFLKFRIWLSNYRFLKSDNPHLNVRI